MRTSGALAAGVVMMLAMAVVPTTASAQCTQWKALAWNSRGDYVFKCFAENEHQLKRDAIFRCEQKWGHSCAAIAVPSTWKLALVHCRRHEGSTIFYNSFAGGSAEGNEVEIAYRKAARGGYPRYTCRFRARY